MATCTIDKKQEEVVSQLSEVFGKALSLDVIQHVASFYQYDLDESTDKLIEITNQNQESGTMHPSNRRNGNVTPKTPKQNSCTMRPSTSTPSLEKKSKKAKDIDRAIQNIQSGYKVMILMRGVPGCGKSHLANTIITKTIGSNFAQTHILSTDDYFFRNGSYDFNPAMIPEAHGWNHNRAFKACSRGISPVIIDNTNTQMWEMKPYGMIATDYGYIIEILEPDTHWCYNEKELARRNSHGVPKIKIKEMLERFQRNITSSKLLQAYNLKYNPRTQPPQFRCLPPLKKSMSSMSLNTDLKSFAQPQCRTLQRQQLHQTLLVEPDKFKDTTPKETINLMEFNDEEPSKNPSKSVLNVNGDSLWNLGPVDKILMWDEDNTSSVLQPSSDDADSRERKAARDSWDANKFFSDVERAWGVNKDELKSWDIVTPLNHKDTDNQAENSPEKSNRSATKTTESSCNTSPEDFNILHQDPLNIPNVVILPTQNRPINLHTPTRAPTMPKKIVVDKSCQSEGPSEDMEYGISKLLTIFPNVAKKYLSYFFTKYNGDLDYIIEMLLLTDSDSIQVLATEPEVTPPVKDEEFVMVPQEEEVFLKRKVDAEEMLELKRSLEGKVNISDDFYSDHLLRIKNRPVGKVDPQPSTSNEEVIIDSDADSDASGGGMNEMVELNLGEALVSQLEQKFGDPSLMYPKGFQPSVQVPANLARQLYIFYLESVYEQMDAQAQVLDTLIKEDEEFARKLQDQENEHQEGAAARSLNFQDIVKEQLVESARRNELEQLRNLTPETLAQKLTKQKLFSVFPTVDKNVLLEIYYANDCNYEETVDSVVASVGVDNVNGSPETIREVPINDATLSEMKEAHQSSSNKSLDEQREATYYREEATKYLNRRYDLYQKAQQYYQRSMVEVAQFYSNLASQQTSYYDQANSLAAVAFVEEHSNKNQDFNTLDLHFLYVKEAIPALDVFLDRNINLLKGNSKKRVEELHIITGRGKRSANGISKLKPPVMARLRKRNIKYVELNPGLLKIKVTDACKVTSELT